MFRLRVISADANLPFFHVLPSLCVCCVCVVLVPMRRCLQETIDYTRDRKAFGRSVLDNQVVHFRLAELETELEALRAMAYKTVSKATILY